MAAHNQPNHESWVVGIDLGTANTRAAVFRNDRVELIPDIDGNRSMPTCVSFTDRGRLIGSSTKRQHAINSANTLTLNFSRLIGYSFGFNIWKKDIDELPFKVVQGPGSSPAIRVTYLGEEKEFSLVEILSMILARVKHNAEVYLRAPIAGAVISMPSGGFGISYADVIRDAAKVANINVWHVMTAPSAIATFLVQHPIPSLVNRKVQGKVAIIDIGAGSCDIGVGYLGENSTEILATGGHCFLSGEAFFICLVHDRAVDIRERANYDILENKGLLSRLRSACEAAIRELSTASEACIFANGLLKGKDYCFTVTRSMFEDLCGALFEHIIHLMNQAICSAWGSIFPPDHIVLVGGLSRIPLLREILGRKCSVTTMSSDEQVVSGLAIKAATLRNERGSSRIENFLFWDGLPVRIMIGTRESDLHDLEPLVLRDMRLPAKVRVEFLLIDRNWLYDQRPSGPEAPDYRVRNHRVLRPCIQDCLYIYEALGCCRQGLDSPGSGMRGLHEAFGEYRRPQMGRFARLICKIDVTSFFQSPRRKERVLSCQVQVARDLTASLTLRDQLSGASISVSLNTRLRGTELSRMIANEIEYQGADNVGRNRTRYRKVFDRRPANTTGFEGEAMTSHRQQTGRNNVAEVSPNARGWAGESTSTVFKDDINRYSGNQTDQNPQSTAPRMEDDASEESDLVDALKERIREIQQGLAIIDGLTEGSSRAQYDSISKTAHATWSQLQRGARLTRSDRAKLLDTADRTISQLNDIQHTEMARQSGATVGPSATSEATIIPTPVSFPPVPPVTPIVSRHATHASAPYAREGLDTLKDLFPDSIVHRSIEKPFTDREFDRISDWLRGEGRDTWSKIPRIYTVLFLVEQLESIEDFVTQGMTDIWFPFTSKTLPSTLRPSIKNIFLDAQRVVLSNGFNLENDPDRKHAQFSPGEWIPFVEMAPLGRGAHGVVHKVVSTITHRQYARKLSNKLNGLQKVDNATFFTELATLKRIDHRHCVELVGSYTDPHHFAIIMQPVADCNLLDYYVQAQNNRDKLSVLRSFFGCLANALHYLHEMSIQHRDIKPQNILVKDQQVFLADFGISRDWENLTRGTTTADCPKTRAYAAPEVIQVQDKNDQSDIWSLGCVFLEMVTVVKGKTVTEMADYFQARPGSIYFHAHLESIAEWVEHLRLTGGAKDNAVLEWVMDMLKRTPKDRPTAQQLVEKIVGESDRSGVVFCATCCHDEWAGRGQYYDEKMMSIFGRTVLTSDGVDCFIAWRLERVNDFSGVGE